MDEGARQGVDAGLDKVTIQEAARRLGVSEGAVRKRVTRGSLPHEKAPDGRVYVYLDVRGIRGVDTGLDEGVDLNSNALISRLEGEVDFLRDQVRRQQEIIAQQSVTMRQLSASSNEPTETPETVQEEPESAEEPQSDAAQPQTATQRSWWRRMFGG